VSMHVLLAAHEPRQEFDVHRRSLANYCQTMLIPISGGTLCGNSSIGIWPICLLTRRKYCTDTFGIYVQRDAVAKPVILCHDANAIQV
jgi:hypothetical protein